MSSSPNTSSKSFQHFQKNYFVQKAQKLRKGIVRIFASYSFNETAFLLVLSAFIGLAASLGSVGFRWLIETIKQVLLISFAEWLGNPYLLPIIPAFGGLLVGALVIRWAREARGHGVPEVMAAVATEEGRIRPRVAFIKSLASALCIGSGGSVGREGPIVQIGSALGSSVGQLFGVKKEHLKVLVGCGAAAGISATFNAPLAGGFFALEVILGDFSAKTLSPILLSSVLANAFARHMVGNDPAFNVPEYHLISFYELLFYTGLAILAGVVSVLFIRILYRTEDAFDSLPISNYLKPVIGGAVVGCIAIFLPQVFGVGYEAITDTLLNRMDLSLIAVLFGAKLVATSLTLGSGGSGGVFAPSLFIGSMLGGAYGQLINFLWPTMTAQSGAYALVGMGAVVAGTTHAPLTAMLILFELTDDYQIILPLMLATVVSTLISKRIEKESIYTLKLARRGLRISQGINFTILDSIRSREVMETNFDFVKIQTPLGEIVDLLQHSKLTDFPVVNNDDTLQGLVSFQDIRSIMIENELYSLLIAADIISEDPPAIEANASLTETLAVFAETDVYNLPVVADSKSRRLVGVITRSKLMNRYNQELQMHHKFKNENTLKTKEVIS